MSSRPSKRTRMDSEPSNNEDEPTSEGNGADGMSQDLFSSPSSPPTPPPTSWAGTSLHLLPRGPHHDQPGTVPPLPPPQPGPQHSVAVKLPLGPGLPLPHPSSLKDVWDEHHVRLPWSRENLYPVEEGGRRQLRSRWQLVLQALQRPLRTSQDLELAILSYNSRYEGKHDWDFSGLHHLFTEVFEPDESEAFFASTLPGMVELVVSSPSVLTCPLPLLRAGTAHSTTLSQHQVSCLLANAFFCTFPRRNVMKAHSEFSNYPMINFNALFGKNARRQTACLEKLKCLLCYFSQVTSRPRQGLVTFSRLSLPAYSRPRWAESTNTLAKLHLDWRGTIEQEGEGMLQADFANRFIGGGVLRSGLVQEEIRFTICPELIASLVFTEALEDQEAVLITGAEQFCSYTGYGDSFLFTGRVQDTTEQDASRRRRTSVVAMDALRFSGFKDPEVQFDSVKLDRELNKAFVAFQKHGEERMAAVATGNWGCGAFGGDVRLKLVLQLLAASEAGRDVAYFTFGDRELVEEGAELYQSLQEAKMTVGRLYKMVRGYGALRERREGKGLYKWIGEGLGEEEDGARGVDVKQEPNVNMSKYDDETDEDDPLTKSDIVETYQIKAACTDSVQNKQEQHFDQDEKENLEKKTETIGSRPHAQGMLSVLDKMEKGELKHVEQYDEDGKTDTPPLPTVNVGAASQVTAITTPGKKQSKMTDFLSKC